MIVMDGRSATSIKQMVMYCLAQKRPTPRPPDLGQAQPIQSMKPLPQAGNANRSTALGKGKL